MTAMPGTTLGQSNQVEVDIAVAATVNIGATINAKVRITGDGTITSFGSVPRKLRFLRFSGTVMLVNSANLALPGGVDFVTAPGDGLIAGSDATGKWTIYGTASNVAYEKGTALAAPPFHVTRNLKDLGALEGDDPANIARNDAVMAEAADSGLVWKVPGGGLFEVGTKVELTSGAGFESSNGADCEFLMNTDAGHFDRADYNNPEAANACMFRAAVVDDVTLLNLLVRLKPPTGGYTSNPGAPGQTIPRVAMALQLRDVGGYSRVRIGIRDFREQRGGWTAIDSCDRGRIDFEVNAWDCNPTSDSLPQGQGSVFEMDSNRSSAPWAIHDTGGRFQGFSSWNVHIYGVRGWNIKAQEPWLTGTIGNGGGGFGSHQTDICALSHSGTTAESGFGDRLWIADILIEEVLGEGVGEVLDCQKAGIRVRKVWGREVYDSGVCKMVYGPTECQIDEVYADLTKRYAVTVQPAKNALNSPAGRNIHHLIFRKVIGRRIAGLLKAAQQNFNITGIQIANSDGAGAEINRPYDIYFDDVDIEGGYAIDNPSLPVMHSGIYSNPLASIGARQYVRGRIRNYFNSRIYPGSAHHDVDTDLTPKWWDVTDPTKRMAIDVSGLSSGIDRVLTLPNKSGTLAMLSDVPAGGPGLDADGTPRTFELGGAAFVDIADVWRWPFTSTAAGVSLTPSHSRRSYLVTANATFTLPAAADVDDTWVVLLKARGGTITLNAQGADTIDGGASISITTGNRAMIMRTGASAFEAF